MPRRETKKATPESSEAPTVASTKPDDKPVVVVQPDLTAQQRKEAAQDAEIRWCLKVIQSHFSYNSNLSMKELFVSMFPDSNIAKDYAMSKDKAAYQILYGIAPHFKRAQRLIYDALETGKFKPFNFPINDKLRRSCLGASSKRRLALAARKTEQVDLPILNSSCLILIIQLHTV